MNKQEFITLLNHNKPPCLQTLSGSLLDFDQEDGSAKMTFDISDAFCHSGNIVQGGFVAAMLDAAMVHALFGSAMKVFPVPSLELKISYIAPSLAGKFTVTGKVIKAGKSVGFLEASLFDENGELTATASSTVRMLRDKS